MVYRCHREPAGRESFFEPVPIGTVLSDNGVREMKMRAMIVMIAVVLTAVFASSALGAGSSSAKAAYGKKGSSVQAVLSAKTTKATKAAPKKVVAKHAVVKAATLPFTGLDLGFVAGAGVVLLGMGFSLRRVTRKPPVV
jgi:hypothetical protein